MILLTVLLTQVYCLIEIHRSLTDGLNNVQFSNDGGNFTQYKKGWYMKRKDQNLNPLIESKYVSGNQYFGLYLIFENDGLVKTLEGIPPHSMLHVSGKFAVCGKKQLMVRRIQLRIDNNYVQSTSIHSRLDTNELNPFLHEISVLFVHTYSTAIIQFTNDFASDYGDLTMGIRDIVISYVPCPVGCLICLPSDKIGNCGLWVPQNSALSTTTPFNNDGWITDGKIQYYLCQGYNLGPFDSTSSVNRTILLDSHYEIRFMFLLTLLNLEHYESSAYKIELDGVLIYSFHFFFTDNIPDICADGVQFYNKDVVQRIDVSIRHTSRIATISLYEEKYSAGSPTSFTIRNFELYIKKCYAEIGFSCDECSGPSKQECIFREGKKNFQFIAQSDFVANSGWQVIMPLLMLSFLCNQEYLLGLDPSISKDYYLQKRFKNLPAHTSLKIVFDLYQIDDFLNEQIQLILDGKIIDTYILNPLDYSNGNMLCGIELEYDGYFNKSIIVPHSDSMATIQIASRATSTTATFGIKNFQLFADSMKISKDLFNLKTITSQTISFYDWIATKITDEIHLDSILCPGITLLGALQPNQKITRRINIDDSTNPADCHSQIQIQFSLYIFSSILDNQSFTLELDGKIIWKQILGQYCYEICGSNLGQVIKGDVYLNHTKSASVLDFSTTANVERWGISNFFLKKNLFDC